MASYCKVILMGRVATPPTTTASRDGSITANFTLAVSRRVRRQDGTEFQESNFIGVVVPGELAGQCPRFLGKGKPVYVEGILRQYTTAVQKKNHPRRHTLKVEAQVVATTDSAGEWMDLKQHLLQRNISIQDFQS